MISVGWLWFFGAIIVLIWFSVFSIRMFNRASNHSRRMTRMEQDNHRLRYAVSDFTINNRGDDRR